MSKRSITKAIILIASVMVTLILAEGLLRVFGFGAWVYKKVDANEPTMHAPDPVLGWRNKEGSYVVPPYDPSGESIYLTFLDNGQRRTGVDSSRTEGEIVIVGGSFSQGWAVSDSETYAWKLQEKYPSLKVVNYGTGGYGSYQALLSLERELPRLTSPKLVLYGFVGHHEERNVAPGSWLRSLSSHSRRGHVAAPFATFDDSDGLVRHPPEGYVKLPFREASALVALIERGYMTMKTRKRLGQRRSVTEAVLLQMDEVCREYGATLIVVFFTCDIERRSHYIDFATENGIPVINCDFPLTSEMRVPGEGHPNGRMHALWAERISRALDDELKKITGSRK